MQVGNAGNLELTLQQYEEIIHRKTAILYGLSCKLGAMLSGASPEQADALERYGNRMGEAFQIIDDSLDLVGDPELVGKSLGTDLGNGKLTLPVLMLREALDQSGRDHLLQLLKTCHESEDAAKERQEIAHLLAEHRIMEQVKERARAVIQDALDSLRLQPIRARASETEDLAEYILQREL